MEEIKPIKQNDAAIKVIKIILVFIILTLVFGLGIFVGGTKARFSYRWTESYHKNFAGPKGGFLNDWRQFPPFPDDFMESHGAFGKIIQINDSDFVIKGKGDLEKIIIIKEDTILENGRTAIKKDDLKIDDQVVIIGSPNDQGQIEAKLIRIFNGENIKTLPSSPRFP
jgi:hypothetical protein